MQHITADQIKPAIRGKSDFFSWQLYRFLKKNPQCTTIWRGTWNSLYGVDEDRSVIYIGLPRDNQWIHCRSLRNLCSMGANLDMFAYGSDHDTINWVDISEEFWSDYMKRGVCAIHGIFAHSWIINGDIRVCEYCGKFQKKKTQMVEIEKWV